MKIILNKLDIPKARKRIIYSNIPWLLENVKVKKTMTMTWDEYHESVEFKTLRLLGNLTHEIQHKTQQLYDVLNIVNSQHTDFISDKFNIYERQLKVLSLESGNLLRAYTDLQSVLRPKNEM